MAKNNYVDNEKFLEEITKYRIKCLAAKEAEEEKPMMNDFLGKTILDLATNLAYNRRFINYTFREDMISNAIYDCVRYAHNFNPEKTKNPFGYFTQISWYAFLRTIKKHKHDLYVKYKVMNNKELHNELHDVMEDDDRAYLVDNGYNAESMQKIGNFIREYEDNKK